MPPAPASNGCSQPTKPASKWAAPILPPPKSHNHCAEPLGTVNEAYLPVDNYIAVRLRRWLRSKAQAQATKGRDLSTPDL